MRLRLPTHATTCAIALLALAPASAARADSVMYGINDDTSWSRGCFGGLCLCPIQLNPDVRGSMTITEADDAGATITYDVTDVNWVVGEGAFSLNLTGCGTYTRVLDGGLHQLELALSVNGGAPAPYDSGLVDGGGDFPAIEISIQNGIDLEADCIFGTIIDVDTSPAPEAMMSCFRSDLDGDYTVGFADLLGVLGNWGACTACPADIDGNGVVAFGDLLELLAHWGGC